MKVQFTRAVLDDAAAFPVLDGLLELLERERHILDPLVCDVFDGCRWLQGAGRAEKRAREFIEKALVEGGNRGRTKMFDPHQTTLLICKAESRQGQIPGGCLRMTPNQALAFLRERLIIMVENEDSDGGFIRLVMQRYGSPSSRRLFSDSDVVNVDGPGGKNRVKSKVKKLKTTDTPHRLIVVVFSAPMSGSNNSG